MNETLSNVQALIRKAQLDDNAAAAIGCLETARSERGDLPELLMALVGVQIKWGMLPEAVASARILVEAHPKLSNGWLQLAIALQMTGDLKQAVGFAQRAIDLDPNNQYAWLKLAESHCFLGELEEGRRAFHQMPRRREFPDRPKIARSIVIPVLQNEPGGRHDVAALLDDLSAFDGEVVIVFNNPDTVSALKDHPRISRYCANTQNVGVGRAWNMGLAMADGPVVFVLNSDLRLSDLSSLSALEAGLEIDDRTVITGVGGEFVDPTTLRVVRAIAPEAMVEPVVVDSVPGHLFAIHVDRFNDAGLSFDTRLAPFFCEELDIGLQARRAGLKVRAMPTTGWRHSMGISRNVYPVSFLGTPVDRNRALLDARLTLREKWRRVLPVPTSAPAGEPEARPSAAPPPVPTGAEQNGPV